MKKLVIGFGTVLSVLLMSTSFKTSHTILQKAVDSSGTLSETLNGISPTNASVMVQNTISTIDSSPVNTHIWFSRPTIDSVYTLLKSDSATTQKPDGIRIYFANTPLTDSSPLHYNSGIVVTSTFNSGSVFQNHATLYFHTDYFEHQQNAGLFKLDSIGGTISHDVDTLNGALLYKNCTNCDITKPCVTSSDHDIKRSVGEKMVQASYGEPFNAKSEWFDIGMLRNLVQEMSDEKDDGIRIYFARGVDSVDKPEDVGKARFVIVTTRPGINPVTKAPIHKDYFDCIHPLLLSVTVHSNGDKYYKGGGNDNGELCPNHCQGAILPTP